MQSCAGTTTIAKALTSKPQSIRIHTGLPYELVLSILEHAYFVFSSSTKLGGWTPDFETLSSCSLVCGVWRNAAQRLLFHEILHINPRFIDAIRSGCERALALAENIRRLELRIYHILPASLSGGRFGVDDFLTVLAACRKLYEITLRTDGLHSFDKGAMDKLRALSDERSSLSSVVALNLMSFGTQSPILYQLLSVMRAVRYLRVGTELAAPCPPEPCPVHLYELALFRTPSNARNVQWLLSSSEGHLRVLEFRDTPGRCYDPLLSIHGPNIRSFRILRQEMRSASIFQLCPNMEELIIYQFSDIIPIRNIPTSVRHLSFRYSPWAENNTLRPVVEAVERLPSLHLVSCNEETEKHPHFQMLKAKCREKNVRLRVDAPPVFIRDDPIPLRDESRWKCVANFPLMNLHTSTVESDR
ncbi:unnamed protein product [Somion occarium]|uniref:F-box domain-containing protein n=1 Tax=Somion occarium TaxID=3059160 RepID=A0ABP1DZD0_9APHY